MPNKYHRDGPALYAQWGCLSTRAWMLSMGNRPVEPVVPTRWVNCSTMAAILYPLFLWQCLLAPLCNWAVIPPGCFSRWVFVQPGWSFKQVVFTVFLRYDTVLLRPLANLRVRNTEIWQSGCNRGPNDHHGYTAYISCIRTEHLVCQGKCHI